MLFSLLGLAGAAKFYHAAEPVPGSYIVVFNGETTHVHREKHFNDLSRFSLKPRKFGRLDFHGYSANLTSEALGYILSLPEVNYVEENGVVRISDCLGQKNAPWGIVRTNEKELKVDGDYFYDNKNETREVDEVLVYVVDTGIRITHTDFKDWSGRSASRAQWGFNSADTSDTDGNGHGTHVAGTIGGETYGLEKNATLVAVKVLDNSGSGTYAGVIDGILWVAQNFADRKTDKKIAVANMSLGGSKSTAVNDAVDKSSTQVLFVVAAGNSNANACNYSPASAAKALSVGATDKTDTRASFSNYGTCTHVFAPGVNIPSAWYTSDTATNTISGTSMASPHVCGVAAKIIAESELETPEQLRSKIYGLSTPNLVKNPGTGSNNRLLYHSCKFE